MKTITALLIAFSLSGCHAAKPKNKNMKPDFPHVAGLTMKDAWQAIGVDRGVYQVIAVYDVNNGSFTHPPVQGSMYKDSVIGLMPKKAARGRNTPTVYLRVKNQVVTAVASDPKQLMDEK